MASRDELDNIIDRLGRDDPMNCNPGGAVGWWTNSASGRWLAPSERKFCGRLPTTIFSPKQLHLAGNGNFLAIHRYETLGDVELSMGAVSQQLRQLINAEHSDLRSCRCLLDISCSQKLDYPDDVPLPICPSVDTIRQMLQEESLIVTVYTCGGYSFSSEYTEVYKGKFHASQAYDDLCVVIERALLSIIRRPTKESPPVEGNSSSSSHSSMQIAYFESVKKYAAFIVQSAAWESRLAPHVCEKALNKQFPKMLEPPIAFESEGFRHVEVYLGRGDANDICWDDFGFSEIELERLYFVIRVNAELHPPHTRDEKIKLGLRKRRSASHSEAANESQNDDLTQDVDVHLNEDLESISNDDAQFIYYRRFQLKREADIWMDLISSVTTTAEAEAGSNSHPPPPPPRRGSRVTGDEAEGQSFDVFLILPIIDSTNGDMLNSDNSPLVTPDVKDQRVENSASATLTEEVKDTRKSKNVCSQEIFGWGFDACKSLGLGSQMQLENNVSGAKGRTAAIQSKNDTSKQSSTAIDSIERDAVYVTPRRIPIHKFIAVERVKQISCSANHTLLLTQLGAVFGCGDNAEGALGVGDFITRGMFTPITQIEDEIPVPSLLKSTTNSGILFPAPIFIKVAAGCTSIGAHSMAIAHDGALYGWGSAYAAGSGSLKAVLRPQSINFPVHKDNDSTVLEDSAADKDGKISIVDVACGGGFTVCVTDKGAVYSWGMWAHGRLGLGPIPRIAGIRGPYARTISFAGNGNKNKVARYQLSPRRLEDIENAVAVSCGEAHAICVLRDGSILSWGQNSCGQLGCGPFASGALSDAFRPVLVPTFGSEHAKESVYMHRYQRFLLKNGNSKYLSLLGKPIIQAVAVSCGAFHSAVIDLNGLPWTWGARGSPCLGHCDAPITTEDWGRRIDGLFSISTTQTRVQVPFDLICWCIKWSMPRPLIAAFGSDITRTESGQQISAVPHYSKRIVQIGGGDLSTAFLSADGRLYLCGSGPAVPNFLPSNRANLLLRDNSMQNVSGDEEVADNSSPTTEQLKQELAQVVKSPRTPSDCWLRELCSHSISLISTGCGCRMFAVADEEVISPALTSRLLDRLLSQPATTESVNGDASDVEDVKSHFSGAGGTISTLETSNESLFASRGRADCLILASGKAFLCHKALIAQRSPELRDRIYMESPIHVTDQFIENESGGISENIVQIMLPELTRDAARALLFFLYRDTLPVWVVGSVSLLTALERTGRILRIPRLQLLSERYMKLLQSASLEGSGHHDSSFQMMPDLPPPTLARDLGALLGDPEFADVRFIAEGRAIFAHRFILESRQCAYFRAMFRSGMTETANSAKNEIHNARMVDVVVPDTFVGFLRLLLFLYTNTLPDGSDGALLEDLMAADRYGIPELKEVCEHMLIPQEHNWLDILRAAELLQLQYLKQQVKSFLRDKFSTIIAPQLFPSAAKSTSYQNESVEGEDDTTDGVDEYSQRSGNSTDEMVATFQFEFPGVLSDLLHSRREILPRVPSTKLVQQVQISSELEAEVTKQEELPAFPLWTLVVVAASLFLYQHISRIVALGSLIPLVNVIFLIVLVFIGLRFYNG